MSDNEGLEQINALMKKGNTASIEKIMDKFIVADKNLILKTDIENSRSFTILKTIVDDLRSKKLNKSAKTLDNFCTWYIKVRCSNKRLSRTEILNAISAIKRENASTTIGAKLFGWGNKNE